MRKILVPLLLTKFDYLRGPLFCVRKLCLKLLDATEQPVSCLNEGQEFRNVQLSESRNFSRDRLGLGELFFNLFNPVATMRPVVTIFASFVNTFVERLLAPLLAQLC